MYILRMDMQNCTWLFFVKLCDKCVASFVAIYLVLSQCVGGSKEKIRAITSYSPSRLEHAFHTLSCLLSTCKHAYQSFISTF